jgi:hypothetical protein
MKILCVETGKMYQSTKEAARKTGATEGGISRCRTNPKASSGGYHWRFLDGTPVVQIDGEGNIINWFESINKACEYIGSRYVFKVVNGNGKTCKGYFWRYARRGEQLY